MYCTISNQFDRYENIFYSSGTSTANVVALDERNLKRAVNRYGTMPKGARIGAYLESLRQSGMTPEPVTEQGVESDAVVDSGNPGASESMDRSMIGKPSKANQMLRSNSSHGGFSGIVNNNASVTKSPSNNQVMIRIFSQKFYDCICNLVNRKVANTLVSL